MPDPLTPLGRRVLGNLPAWSSDEAWVIEQEGGPESSVRSHALGEIAQALASNPAAGTLGSNGPLTEGETEGALIALQEAGLAEHIDGPTDIEGITHENAWRMTQAGLEALNAVQGLQDAPPGAVTMPLHPAQVTDNARG
jgi:hypothetical protein